MLSHYQKFICLMSVGLDSNCISDGSYSGSLSASVFLRKISKRRQGIFAFVFAQAERLLLFQTSETPILSFWLVCVPICSCHQVIMAAGNHLIWSHFQHRCLFHAASPLCGYLLLHFPLQRFYSSGLVYFVLLIYFLFAALQRGQTAFCFRLYWCHSPESTKL